MIQDEYILSTDFTSTSEASSGLNKGGYWGYSPPPLESWGTPPRILGPLEFVSKKRLISKLNIFKICTKIIQMCRYFKL